MSQSADSILFGPRAVDDLWLLPGGMAGERLSVLGINHQFWCFDEEMAFRASGPEIDMGNPWDQEMSARTDKLSFLVAAQGVYAFEQPIGNLFGDILWQGEDEHFYSLPASLARKWENNLQRFEYRNYLLAEEIALERFQHPAVLLATRAEQETSLLAWAPLPRRSES